MFEVKINYYYVFTIKCEFLDSSENFIAKIVQTRSIFKLFFRYIITLDNTVFKPRIDQNFTIFEIFWAKNKLQLYIFTCLKFTFLMKISIKKDYKFKLKIDF